MTKIRTHLVNDPSEPGLVPRHLTKQEFARRLYQLMLAKGWNQSELGRQAGLPRDAISVYMRGKSLPTPQNLKALAEAFGISEIELLPNHTEAAIDEDMPAFELRVSVSSPNMAWLRVNRLVSLSTGVKIAELLEQDNVPHRERGGDAPAV